MFLNNKNIKDLNENRRYFVLFWDYQDHGDCIYIKEKWKKQINDGWVGLVFEAMNT
jgi:hypothetical protein